jgi:hypothetical protein
MIANHCETRAPPLNQYLQNSSATLRELRALRVNSCKSASMHSQLVFHAEDAVSAEVRGEHSQWI